MKIEKRTKLPFSVIGKEGSTLDGQDFIQKLWEDANSHFAEVQSLAKKDENGNLVGVWGAMSDFTRSFHPWEDNFTKGLYLAGVECADDAGPPAGWTKWTIPGYEYLCAEAESESTFSDVLEYMNANDIALVGAVHDFTCPSSGKNYMFFPSEPLDKPIRRCYNVLIALIRKCVEGEFLVHPIVSESRRCWEGGTIRMGFWLPSRAPKSFGRVGCYGLPRYHGRRLVGALQSDRL